MPIASSAPLASEASTSVSNVAIVISASLLSIAASTYTFDLAYDLS